MPSPVTLRISQANIDEKLQIISLNLVSSLVIYICFIFENLSFAVHSVLDQTEGYFFDSPGIYNFLVANKISINVEKT